MEDRVRLVDPQIEQLEIQLESAKEDQKDWEERLKMADQRIAEATEQRKHAYGEMFLAKDRQLKIKAEIKRLENTLCVAH